MAETIYEWKRTTKTAKGLKHEFISVGWYGDKNKPTYVVDKLVRTEVIGKKDKYTSPLHSIHAHKTDAMKKVKSIVKAGMGWKINIRPKR